MLVEKPGHTHTADLPFGPPRSGLPAPLPHRAARSTHGPVRPGTQPVVVPPSKPFGMAESFFSALNSSVAWVLFHSTESPAFV
jgi:hypothetical protein